MKNEGSMLLLGDFNARTATNRFIILSNDSKPNPLLLDDDLVLANSYKINSEDLIENLFGTELIKIYSSQDLLICNGIKKWPNSNRMTCIHGLGSNVVDYVISDIPIYNQIVNFDLLDDHELDSYHRPITLTLNFSMHTISINEHFDNQRHLPFDNKKIDLFLKDLSNDLKFISYQNNIEFDYHSFTSTLSTSINNLSIQVLCKKKNNISNLWYDNECKIARKSNRDAANESLKYDKINRYKTLIKRGKKDYINRKQEKILHLFKIDPNKFWRQILTRKTKENNNIPLRDWNFYLENMYESPNVMDNMPKISTKDEVFSIEEIKFGVKWLSKGKSKDIEGYQAEILTIGGPILTRRIHKLFNLAI
jgi:hypothetical protein